jgi:hypothetical protein
MDARLTRFGEIEIEGRRYAHDVVIEGGRVRKRRKKPSKPMRDRYGHTPLTAAEEIPWSGRRLIVGTGAAVSCRGQDLRAGGEPRRGLVALPKRRLPTSSDIEPDR